MAAVCSLLIGVVIARAQPVLKRPVAVIDLSGDLEGEKLAKKLGLALLDHPMLSPVPDPALPGELMGAFVDEDADRIARTRTDKQSAEDRLAAYQFASAASTARDAQDTLLRAHPSPSVIKLYGELAFVLGQARLGERRPLEAAAAFRLAYHLMPSFAPIRPATSPRCCRPSRARGRRFTSREAGDPGQRADLGRRARGRDRVGLVEPVRRARGRHARRVADRTGPPPRGRRRPGRSGENSINITDAPADDRLKVRRAREMLRAAPDSAARAAAMKQLAQVLGARDAILLSSANGQLAFQTWRDQAPGFSIVRQIKSQRPIDILEQLAPPPEEDEVIDETPLEMPVPPLVWYERPTVRVGIIVGVVSAVVGTVLLVRSIDRTVDVSPPMWGQP